MMAANRTLNQTVGIKYVAVTSPAALVKSGLFYMGELAGLTRA